MIEIIRTLLAEWRGRKIPEAKERDTSLSGYAEMKPPKITALTGFRRSGKTYMLFGLARELLKEKSRDEVVYLNFEDERIPLKTGTLSGLVPALKEAFGGKTRFLLLDEIQNIPGWGKWLRRVYDTEDIRLFVTGSSSKMSSREIPTELRGRFLEVHVFPLSFREFLAFKGIALDAHEVEESEDAKASALHAFNEYLEFGGLPEVVLAEEGRKAEILQGYYNTLVRRDIIERFKVRNEEALKALLQLAVNSTSYSSTKLYNTLKSAGFEVGKGTVQAYLAHIENSYFLHSLPIASYKAKDRLLYPRKIYLIDNGFITSLSSRHSKNTGRLYENLAFMELKRRTAGTGAELAYWRNQQKEEVDFVVTENLRTRQLIQVCFDIGDYDTKKRETRALLKAAKELKCASLLVLTGDKQGKEKTGGKTITYLPLWKWLLQGLVAKS